MTKKKEIENLAIIKAWDETEKFYENIVSIPKPGIYINDGQPGTGKTESLAKIISKTDKKYAFFTTNHHHIEKFEKDLKKYKVKRSDYIHGGGFERSCKKFPPKTKTEKYWTKDEKFIHKIHHEFKNISPKILCKECKEKSCCNYYDYINNANKYRITLQPLEFLFTSYNSDKDIFILDEAVIKRRRYLWNFSFSKLRKFIEQIEMISGREYILKDYFHAIFEFHRKLLQDTSLIFKEKPETLFKMDSNTFSTIEFKNKMFLQHDNLITHPETVTIDDYRIVDTPENIFELSKKDHDDSIFEFTIQQINKTVASKKEKIINELIDSFVPIFSWIKFLEIFFNKDPGGKISFIVSESLEKGLKTEPSHIEKIIITIDGNYEKGFFDEFPYIKDITTGEMIISRMGKEFEGLKENPNTLDNAWCTTGQPYLFRAFDIARKKPVILLDATFNKVIFDKLQQQWFNLYTFLEVGRHSDLKISEVAKKFPKKNIRYIKKLDIKNNKSIVYNVEEHFPLTSLRSNQINDVIGFIATIIDDNPSKSYAIISHKEFEEKFKELFPKAITAHHSDQRGKTIDCDLLFVVGTPYTPPATCPYEYVLNFYELPESIDKKDSRRFTGYKDHLLQEILQVKTHDENYHEMHRTRMLLYNREVYALCELPHKINWEVTVEKIPNMLAISHSALWNLMDIIIKNDGADKKKIYDKVKNRKRFIVAGGWKKLVNDLEKSGYIVFKKKKTKTKPITTIHSTKKGERFHHIQAMFYHAK